MATTMQLSDFIKMTFVNIWGNKREGKPSWLTAEQESWNLFAPITIKVTHWTVFLIYRYSDDSVCFCSKLQMIPSLQWKEKHYAAGLADSSAHHLDFWINWCTVVPAHCNMKKKKKKSDPRMQANMVNQWPVAADAYMQIVGENEK